MKLLIKLLLFAILVVVLYLGSYFVLMEEGTALNRQTLLPEYASISRYGSSERSVGPITVQITFSSWLNPIYEPLDRIFR